MAWPSLYQAVRSRTLALLRPGTDTPDPEWLAPAINDALEEVRTDALSAWLSRGYSFTQVEAWANGHGRPHLISTAFFLVCIDSRTDIKDADGQKVEPSAVLDRRKDWLLLSMTDANGLVAPENRATSGSPLHGNVTTLGPKGRGETFRDTQGCFKQW